MQLQLKIQPRKAAIFLAGISLILTGLSLASEYIVEVLYRGADDAWLRLIDLFSVNLEASIPTWYATILLFAACIVLLAISLMKWQSKDHYGRYWAGLTLIFLYLSMDEGAVIHEVAADPLTQYFHTSGYLYFGWQIVFLPLILIFSLLYLRFLLHLPPRTRYGLIIAGLIYVGGAVVIEGFSAALLAAADGIYTYRYLATATLEELCEMLGIVILIYTLLDYIVLHQGHISIIISDHQKDLTTESAASMKQLTTSNDWFQKQVARAIKHPYRGPIMLFLTGINTILIQWIVLRETTALVQQSEAVLMVIISIFLMGWMISFILRYHPGAPLLTLSATGVFLLHVSLPVWFRLLTAVMSDWVSEWILISITILLSTGFYSLFLPAKTRSKPLALMIQFPGLLTGIAFVLLLGQWGYYPIIIIYSLLLLVILVLLDVPATAVIRLALIVATFLWFLPALNQWSNTVWYQLRYKLPEGITTLVSDYSPARKIDVLQDGSGNLYLYQNGIAHSDPVDAVWRNIIMGRIPASLTEIDTALVIGAASMQMELMIANYGGHVTTVEPDARVAAVSRELFSSYNRMDSLQNRTITIADPQHYLEQVSTRFDLIAVDLPGVYDLSTGSWMNASFFETVSKKLHSGGVFAVNLGEVFAPDAEIPRRVTASLLQHFDDIVVINLGATSYAYAGNNLPYTGTDVQLAIRAAGLEVYGIFEIEAVRVITSDAQLIPNTLGWLSVR